MGILLRLFKIQGWCVRLSKLEEITVGSHIKGIVEGDTVTIVDVHWYGSNVVEITYKDSSGDSETQLLYREDEPTIQVSTQHLPWSFDANPADMKLASEAYRISIAHLFDPYLAVHTSDVRPLPHQISAVYQEMLPRVPLRYVLADDPGAGKTVMTGLYIKELIARGDLNRCLIVSPGSLVEQWQDELYTKFNLKFDILTNGRIDSSVSGNIFTEVNYSICRLDKLARDEDLQAKLSVTDWDLIVVDEAHKMSATIWGGEIKYTKRFKLGRLLSKVARNYLLLTATPHNGKDEDFQLFLSLVDPDRFEGVHHNLPAVTDVSDVMRRLVKEELLNFDGTPLFPERKAYTVNYSLSPQEAELYNEVTDYVREEFNRADRLNSERKATVGFALTILQRRLASSPEAIYQSLRRRCDRLEQHLEEESKDKKIAENSISNWDENSDEDDFTPDEQEVMEDEFVDQASAAATIQELKAEIQTLKRLERMANAVRISGVDRKWEELSKLLQDDAFMFGKNGKREKLIIFTEQKDTLNYLTEKVRSLLGDHDAVVTIHGGMSRKDRKNVEQLFKQDKDVRILIATDAAGEGINLQVAHLMINYDLPWNPNRLEQRFGRIHRIGQMEVCYCWNMVAAETREGYVFQQLLSKLEEERKALGGKVFDILGKVTFNNKALKDLLVKAVRYGNDPEVKAKLNQVVDKSMDSETFRKLIKENALTDDVMDIHTVNTIKEDMERIEAHKLQPHFIQFFFMEAFQSLGGRIQPREKGRYEISFVPYGIRTRERGLNSSEPILKRYERVCFDKEYCDIAGKQHADLICPGCPLLDAVIDIIREKDADVMKRGAVLVDDNDFSTKARLLFYIEDAIQDGTVLNNGKHRIISRHIHFVELKEDDSIVNAGYAPYLDYRAPDSEEYTAIKAWMDNQSWLRDSVEEKAKEYAISELIPKHFTSVKKQRLGMLDKTEKSVKERLTAEIQYWDYRATDLEQKEAAGKTNAHLNSKLAARRADELSVRLDKRLTEIGREKKISPLSPMITGGVLVIPKGLLHHLVPKTYSDPGLFGQGDRRAMEYVGMNAVMQIETSFGYQPKDVSADNVGYDIESFIPEKLRKKSDSNALRFIEVKARRKGAITVTVSKNEILTALNRPEEFILAIVEVDGETTHTVYLKHPFKNAPDFTAASINYNIEDLIQEAEFLYQK